MSDFIHLRVHSSYSLAEGAITPSDLVTLCKQQSMPAVAVTDSMNMFGSLEFSLAASSQGVQPIIGATLNVLCDEKQTSGSKGFSRPIYDEILLLAKDDVGHHNLLKLVSRAYTQVADDEDPHVSMQQLAEFSDGVILLTGGAFGPVGRLILEHKEEEARCLLITFRDSFKDRVYVELTRHGLEEEHKTEETFLDLAYDLDLPIVATNNVYFATQDMQRAHDALLCIAASRFVDEDDRRKVNGEHYFKSARHMSKLFSDLPEAIENTVHIMQRCTVMSVTRDPILPPFGDKPSDESSVLRTLAKEGLQRRLADHVLTEGLTDDDALVLAKPYEERLDFELDVIINMKFAGYFLIVSDFMMWSNRNNVPVGPGRGSGAGSVVAWSLEITDLDPLRFGLLFERFLNPERVSMPDFDIDFCQEKREQVIHYVQKKYGYDKVAQIITFGKLQARAVLRDVGRVLQMPYNQVDRISKMIPFNPANPVTLQEALNLDKEMQAMRKNDPDVGTLIDIALKLEGLNRHSSTHAAGVVIADRPLEELVPVYRDPRSEMPVCGYSMKYAEMAGLVKFDFLGLKTLTVISKACEFIQARGDSLDISKIPLDDRPSYDMLALGDSVGVFQLESAGMRDCLRKMRPDTIDDIIALISLYRPGPMDNIPSYIARKHGLEEPDYLHPMLEEVLKETYGVIIYQEQVMQIAQIMGGYSLGGADLLRRAMGKKIVSEMDKQRDLFVKGAMDNHVEKSQASYIFDLVSKFAGYGFNKSHAAAYAMISYRTAYLKANYTVEFFAASMNLDINDTDKIGHFIQDIKEHGIPILPPDINHSHAHFVPERMKDGTWAIRYGLGALKNVGVGAIQTMQAERANGGAFRSIFDLVSRLDSGVINKRMLENLIRSGAMDDLHTNRRQYFEQVDVIVRFASAKAKEKDSQQVSLFGESVQSQQVPEMASYEPWDQAGLLKGEFQAIGLYLTSHPILAYEAALSKMNVVSSSGLLSELSDGFSHIKLAGVIMSKKTRSSARGKFANVMLSDPSGMFEIAIYDEELLSAKAELLENGALLLLDIDAKKDEGGARLIATGIADLDASIAQINVSYDISLEHSHSIEAIKQRLEDDPSGCVSISFICQVDDHRVTICIPKIYKISIQSIPDIQSLDGVAQIYEKIN